MRTWEIFYFYGPQLMSATPDIRVQTFWPKNLHFWLKWTQLITLLIVSLRKSRETSTCFRSKTGETLVIEDAKYGDNILMNTNGIFSYFYLNQVITGHSFAPLPDFQVRMLGKSDNCLWDSPAADFEHIVLYCPK